jgi:hypothetical protein
MFLSWQRREPEHGSEYSRLWAFGRRCVPPILYSAGRGRRFQRRSSGHDHAANRRFTAFRKKDLVFRCMGFRAQVQRHLKTLGRELLKNGLLPGVTAAPEEIAVSALSVKTGETRAEEANACGSPHENQTTTS